MVRLVDHLDYHYHSYSYHYHYHYHSLVYHDNYNIVNHYYHHHYHYHYHSLVYHHFSWSFVSCVSWSFFMMMGWWSWHYRTIMGIYTLVAIATSKKNQIMSNSNYIISYCIVLFIIIWTYSKTYWMILTILYTVPFAWQTQATSSWMASTYSVSSLETRGRQSSHFPGKIWVATSHKYPLEAYGKQMGLSWVIGVPPNHLF